MGIAPENTRRAFAQAVQLGLRHLETDVRVTADGVPLAFHDRTLDRVTDFSGPVVARTWADLAGTRVHDQEPLLRLEELLGDFPEALISIDVKEERAVAPVIEAVRRTNSADRVCVAGGWDTWLQGIHEACGVTTALGWKALTRFLTAARAGLQPVLRPRSGARFVHVSLDYGPAQIMRSPRLAERVVSMATTLGLDVVAWTVNDAETAARLHAAGVAGVITDRPDLLRSTAAGSPPQTGDAQICTAAPGGSTGRSAYRELPHTA